MVPTGLLEDSTYTLPPQVNKRQGKIITVEEFEKFIEDDDDNFSVSENGSSTKIPVFEKEVAIKLSNSAGKSKLKATSSKFIPSFKKQATFSTANSWNSLE